MLVAQSESLWDGATDAGGQSRVTVFLELRPGQLEAIERPPPGHTMVTKSLPNVREVQRHPTRHMPSDLRLCRESILINIEQYGPGQT